jgi:carnitine O-acetyltransferase
MKNSWLIDWWNQVSYLRYREPVVVNVSFFFVLPDEPTPRTFLRRAAAMAHAAMEFRQTIVEFVPVLATYASESMAPETLRTAPFCMQQYHHLFNSCRIPKKPADTTVLYDYGYRHIVVARKNQFFSLDMCTGDGTAPLDIDHIEQYIFISGIYLCAVNWK